MADNVVDSLLVELGINPDKIKQEEKEALESVARLRSGLKDGGRKVEEEYRLVSKEFEATAKKLGTVLGLLVGASSVVDFTKNTVEAIRRVGILSEVIGESTVKLSSFGNTFARLGGSAESVFSVLSGIDREIKGIEANKIAPGNSSLLKVIYQLNSIGANIKARTDSGDWKRPTELLLEITETIPKLQASRDRVIGILAGLPGISDESMAVMLRSSQALREQIALQKDILVVTEEDKRSAEELRKGWFDLSQRAESLGISMMVSVAVPLRIVFEATSKFIKMIDNSQRKWPEVRGLAFQLPLLIGEIMKNGMAPAPAQQPGGSGSANSGGSDAPPAQQHGDSAAVPQAILEQAKAVALRRGQAGVEEFMRLQGYPKSGPWCGQFAAAAVKAAGGTPPKNPAIASNWRNFGAVVEGQPQPGDIAVRRGAPTGGTGSHVTIVNSIDPQTGRFIGLGGNQGGAARNSSFNTSRYEFRRPGGAFEGAASPAIPFADIGPGAVISGRPNVTNDIRNSTRVDVGSLTVNSQAADPAGIAGDIMRELKAQQNPAGP